MIIETSSQERLSQAKGNFEKIKPLLDKGVIYSVAVAKVFNEKKHGITGKAWFKDIVEYGESVGYPKEKYWGKRYGGRCKQ